MRNGGIMLQFLTLSIKKKKVAPEYECLIFPINIFTGKVEVTNTVEPSCKIFKVGT